jgi:threonine dehydrogenase-like Zn-dependent dehydrogenase
MVDKLLFGSVVNKVKTVKSGQTLVQRYAQALLEKSESAGINTSFVVTHRLPLEDAPAAYKTFRDKEDSCIKAVPELRPT